ncbi:hypothetical protein PFICI_07719 [Pestalotiopsis fici W106-1]|uniref:Heterokaryon incompatibility domain-containing protein n=1 Tax=Pestalotiopsis fici (strain W106-1 / CGMCC3.15140) TaxID=1229662 RepID=W3X283_PESFW|nr:uncharacterized protein PFICI_07719 [Pestalotiopsis fici W106-1]ETS80190.1 hypothetical protein PFICI_07719 [Pestalotiopsis fici W106-1]
METPETRSLCFRCSVIDLSPLTAPLPVSQESHRDPASKYEEQLAVYIQSFNPLHARNKPECNLCNLLAVCANQTGVEVHKAVAIRPKLVWLADVEHGSRNNQSARLHRSGQLHVWFYDKIEYKKSIDGDNVTLKSAVASWMLDIVEEHSKSSPCKRMPISRHADKTMIRNRLATCDSSHTHLPGFGHSASRILHIVSRGLLRAINTTTGKIETLPSLTNFVALSYVWGNKTEPDQSLNAFPITAYPATIRDAATLAQSLGFDWLWVDRICIDQSNENEKAVLIPYIKDIFATASLTIVAASGDGAHSGLPGSPHTPRQGETPLMLNIQARAFEDVPELSPAESSSSLNRHVRALGGVLRLLPAQPSFNTLLNTSVWRTRGWTFEEEVFSRRLLYVFPTEIFFSCDNGTYRESTGETFVSEPLGSTWSDFGATPPLIAGELNVAMQKRRNSSTKLITTRQFVRAVEEYTSRNLTFEEDRVEAFAGLITASTDQIGGISEASLLKHGHPLSFFETALTWHPESDSPVRLPTHRKPFVPSWSWASAGSKVHFLDNGEEDNKSNWFRYDGIGNLDVVGLPSRDILSRELGLYFPTELINSQPWLEKMPKNSPAELDATVTPDVVSIRSQKLPTLHLVSIVFEAMFVKASEGLHSLQLVHDPGVRVTGHWATSSSFISGRQKFAIVAGNANICIMALKPESPGDTFSRMGLLRVAWYSSDLLYSIMRQSRARWEYIRLI